MRSSSRGRKTRGKGSTGHGHGNRGKASQTQENYGIIATNVTPHSVQSSRQPVDYVSLNDGYEDETPSPSKKDARSHTGPGVLPQQHGYLLTSV